MFSGLSLKRPWAAMPCITEVGCSGVGKVTAWVSKQSDPIDGEPAPGARMKYADHGELFSDP